MVGQAAVTEPLVIIGLVGAAVVLCLVVAGLVWWRSLRRRRKRDERAVGFAEPAGGAPHWGRPARSADTGPSQAERPEGPRPEPETAEEPAQEEQADPALQEALEAVRGLGPARSRRLASTYRTLEAIREADAGELAAVKGIGPGLAERLVVRLRPPDEVLADIQGFGPVRRARIAERFPTVATLARAPVEEVAAIEGIGPELARRAVDQAQPG